MKEDSGNREHSGGYLTESNPLLGKIKRNLLFVGLCEPEHLTHPSCDFIPLIYTMVPNYIACSILLKE